VSDDDWYDEAMQDLGEWRVIIEETVGFGQAGQRWGLTRIQSCGNRDEALETARAMAENHQPQHPRSPGERCIYQIGTDSWLIRVPGVTQNFHFRVSVARHVAGSEL
jgi:hypothetical protein